MIILIALVLLLLIAAVWDYYRGKIPNILIILGCCYGMIRLLCYYQIFKFIPGILFPLIILFPLYKIGVMGAGDLKLFAMTGFYFPFMEVVFCIFTAFLLGALISVISFIRYDNFTERITYLFSYLKECLDKGHLQYYYLDSDDKNQLYFKESQSKIHFAIPIFLSVLFHIGGVL